MDLGSRLRTIRGRTSLDNFALLVGVHKNSIARYESGTRIPDVDYLYRVLGTNIEINPAWLFVEEGLMVRDTLPAEDPPYVVEAKVRRRSVEQTMEPEPLLTARTPWRQRMGQQSVSWLIEKTGIDPLRMGKIFLGQVAPEYDEDMLFLRAMNEAIAPPAFPQSIALENAQTSGKSIAYKLLPLVSPDPAISNLCSFAAFEQDWLTKSFSLQHEYLAVAIIAGDSMSPTLNDGDMVIVNKTANRVDEEGIYVLSYRGTLLVKRLQMRLDGKLVVKCDNQKYESEIIASDEAGRFRIEGKALWVGKNL